MRSAVRPSLERRLEEAKSLVIAGSVIPAQDYQFLFDAGVAGVYGPGTVIATAALEILAKLGGGNSWS